jgi:hypothetical protein
VITTKKREKDPVTSQLRWLVTGTYQDGYLSRSEVMKYLSKSSIVTATVLTLSILAGCEKQGPAERAGEAIDDAARETKDKIEDLGE